MVFDAPFGKFAWDNSPLSFNANFGWFLMEIVSPVTFVVSLLTSPSLLSLTPAQCVSILERPCHALQRTLIDCPTVCDRSLNDLLSGWSKLNSPTKLLALLYVLHYLNRSTISVLRNPAKRAPMHLMTFLASVLFNLANGHLMGSWLGGRTRSLLDFTSEETSGGVPQSAFAAPLFWLGLGLWLAGLFGNIMHDNILYDLRRPDPSGKPRPRYSIPQGLLYSRPFGGVSTPSFLCEWVEWLGFALACSTAGGAPALPSSQMSFSSSSAFLQAFSLPTLPYISHITPPWLFLFAELATMVPRALRGHQWYHDKFGKDMPQDRRAVFPGLL